MLTRLTSSPKSNKLRSSKYNLQTWITPEQGRSSRDHRRRQTRNLQAAQTSGSPRRFQNMSSLEDTFPHRGLIFNFDLVSSGVLVQLKLGRVHGMCHVTTLVVYFQFRCKQQNGVLRGIKPAEHIFMSSRTNNGEMAPSVSHPAVS